MIQTTQLNPAKLAFLLATLISCMAQPIREENSPRNNPSSRMSLTLDPYWHDGKAELSSYDLSQVRYGEQRSGEAILIFVTEDFSNKKQVKLDFPASDAEDKQPVLKMNFSKKFRTGIYPYHMLLSTFQPVGVNALKYPLKETANISEWCGQTFAQLNQHSDSFRLRSFSYFESEGDVDRFLALNWTEDGIWSLIRIAPEKLPTGKIKILPGLFYTFLKHKPFTAMDAVAQLEENDLGVKTYSLKYADSDRTLSIRFASSAPYPILSWTETYKEGDQYMTTSANLKKRIKLDYWNYNSNADGVWAKELELQN